VGRVSKPWCVFVGAHRDYRGVDCSCGAIEAVKKGACVRPGA
jgi:hypothetical protein